MEMFFPQGEKPAVLPVTVDLRGFADAPSFDEIRKDVAEYVITRLGKRSDSLIKVKPALYRNLVDNIASLIKIARKNMDSAGTYIYINRDYHFLGGMPLPAIEQTWFADDKDRGLKEMEDIIEKYLLRADEDNRNNPDSPKTKNGLQHFPLMVLLDSYGESLTEAEQVELRNQAQKRTNFSSQQIELVLKLVKQANSEKTPSNDGVFIGEDVKGNMSIIGSFPASDARDNIMLANNRWELFDPKETSPQDLSAKNTGSSITVSHQLKL
jgi:hypothetical protein